MSKRAAIFGSLVDLKNVNAHRCVRLTIDIPAEQATEVVAVFGWPTMAEPVPIAIARMAMDEPKRDEPKKPAERSLAQQAGAMCTNPVFQAFMEAENAEICAELVRDHCGVESRSEIRTGTPAGEKWLDLVQNFHGWEAAEKSGAT